MNSTSTGTLYLIPTTLGDCPSEKVIPPHNATIVAGLDHFIVEQVRTARRFIRKLVPDKPIDPIAFYTLNKHTPAGALDEMVAPLMEGTNMGLISEAGVPGIADPGEEIVAYAHRRSVQVVPLTGPSSLLLALMASGLNGENFAFNGYLPIKSGERIKKIRALEKKSRHEGQTQIFMETPYRNDKLLNDLLSQCMDDTLLCLASNVTTAQEMIRTLTVKQWKEKTPELHKKPTIFILSAGEKQR